MSEDLRVTKTRTAIRNALLELMSEKELTKITISEICARAQINRKTFYCHYRSPDTVIEELENEEDNSEIFQYYIISDAGAQILEDWTNEIVFYNEELDMYVWGVTHYGTAWSYVLTDIKLNCGDEAFN